MATSLDVAKVQATEKKKRGRRGTFNQLEEKYQILPGLEPDHIFEEELKSIEELRQKIPECKELSDKAMVTFLCARRHKNDEVEELLRKYFQKKSEIGLDKNPSTVDDAWKLFKTGYSMRFKNCIDKHDRLVIYTKLALDEPSATTVEEKLRALFWGVEQIIHVEPLKYIRNGMICVVDLSGFGMRNLDMKNGKEVNEALTGVLPRRVRKIYVVGGGLLVKLAMSTAKMVLSKKLMKRVENLDEAGLKDLIPSEWLLEEYGGNLKLTVEDYHQQLIESQKIMDDNIKQHMEKQQQQQQQ